ncbi:hypothetical protein INR49_000767, partial [Caranx melampygus]
IFYTNPRYILFINLVANDMTQVTLSIILFIISYTIYKLNVSICCIFILLLVLTNENTPLNLACMAVECYIAICVPLRHVQICTVKRTSVLAFQEMNESFSNVTVAVRGADSFSKAVTKNVIVMALGISINYINAGLIHTFCKHQIFYTNPRYILFINLVANDMTQVTLSIILFIISYTIYKLNVSICCIFILLVVLTNENTPLNLACMAVECYIAICAPLRHVQICTVKRTSVLVGLIWTTSMLSCLPDIFITLATEPLDFFHSQLTTSISLFVFTYTFHTIYVPVCCLFILPAIFTTQNTPLNLAFMAAECYIAICVPLRYNYICTVKRTVYCSRDTLFRSPFSVKKRDTSHILFLVMVWITLFYTYFRILFVAKAADADAQKARNTILLHGFQADLRLRCMVTIQTEVHYLRRSQDPQTVSMNFSSYNHNVSSSQSYRDSLGTAVAKNVIVLAFGLTINYINGTLIHTFRKHQIFYVNPRYILFIHLVLNDMIQLTTTISLFVFIYVFYKINTFFCCIIITFAVFTTLNTPLNLAVMAVECYIAICLPLRHAELCTLKRTYSLIAWIWAMSAISTLPDSYRDSLGTAVAKNVIVLALGLTINYINDREDSTVSDMNLSSHNGTFTAAGGQLESFTTAVVKNVIVTVLCISINYINGTLVHTFRKHQIFSSCPRYILFIHLVINDMTQLALSTLLHILIYTVYTLTVPFCLILLIITILTTLNTPLNLAGMAVECYIAVCIPLRHGLICTVKKTYTLIGLIWLASSLSILPDLFILLATEPLHYFNSRVFCARDYVFRSTYSMKKREASHISYREDSTISDMNLSSVNGTFTAPERQRDSFTTAVVKNVIVTVLCLSINYVNGTLVHTFRKHQIFSSSPRYILFIHLVINDMTQLALSTLLHILIYTVYTLTVPFCLILLIITILTTLNTPLNLAGMAVECYIAVCIPSIFSSSPRYILFIHLVINDMTQLALSTLLHILIYTVYTLTVPFCLILLIITILTTLNTPLNLAGMAVECYIAVCIPLRHGLICTVKKTYTLIGLIWLASSLSILPDLFILLATEPLHFFHSRVIFSSSPRYILFIHLVINDMTQLALSTLLHILSYTLYTLSVPFCLILLIITILTTLNTPLNLAGMAVECYIAVCIPLRHGLICTVKKTYILIGLIWLASSLSILPDLFILLATEPLHYFNSRVFCARDYVFRSTYSMKKREASHISYREDSTISDMNLSSVNGTFTAPGRQRDSFTTAVVKNVIVTALCLSINYINGTLVHTFRKHQIFSSSPRYILFIHLVINDMTQLALSTLLHILSYTLYTLSVPFCLILLIITILTTLNTPLNLAGMAVECYIAVCVPLRHGLICTVKKTYILIGLIWLASSLSILPDLFILLATEPLHFFHSRVFCARDFVFCFPFFFLWRPLLLHQFTFIRDTFTTAFVKNLIVVLVWLILSYINGTLVATFFRHQTFYEDPRYILFIHMVINDAIQLTVTITLFVLSYIFYKINVSFCCFFILVAVFTTRNTPVNLASMAIERYIAICEPFRHSQICTVRRTYMVIGIIWFICVAPDITDLFVTLASESLSFFHGSVFCLRQNVFKDPVLAYKRQAFDIIYFSCVFLTLIFTYLRILFAARAISTEKTSAQRARNTILLHGVQLAMCLLSYISPVWSFILQLPHWLTAATELSDFLSTAFQRETSDIYCEEKMSLSYNTSKDPLGLLLGNTSFTLTVGAVAAPKDSFSNALTKNIVAMLVWLALSIINSSMVLTFLRHSLFYENPRYIMFICMVINDALQLTLVTALYVVSYIFRRIHASVCCVLIMTAVLTTRSTPLILAGMALERYISICYPLHYSQMCTIPRTLILICVILILTATPPNCVFDGTYLSFVALTLLYTYCKIMLTARAASTGLASVKRARNTVLLHGVQLLLCMLAFVVPSLQAALISLFPHLSLEIRYIFFLLVYIIPRFLSPVIYGFRDELFRKYWTRYLACRGHSVIRVRPFFLKVNLYVLYIHLVINDMIMLTVSTTLQILTYAIPLNFLPCCIMLLITMTTNKNSPLNLAGMAVERYIAVCRPLHHVQICTVQRAYALIALIWGVSVIPGLTDIIVVLATQPLSVFSRATVCYPSYLYNSPYHKAQSVVVQVLLFSFVGLTLVITYLKVLCTAQAVSGSNQESARNARNTILLHGVQLLICMLSFFSPLISVILVTTWPSERTKILLAIFLFMHVLPRLLSPLIYGVRDKKFRSHIRLLLFCKCCSSEEKKINRVGPQQRSKQ